MTLAKLGKLPRLRTLLVLVNLVVLALPLVGVLFLRLYESALIRQTEAELVAQAAVLSAMFKAQRQAVLAGATPPVADEPPAARVPGPLEIARREGLDLRHDPVLPSQPDPQPARPPAPLAAVVGTLMAPVLKEAQEITLAAMRIADARGVIVASTGADVGRSLLAQDEVRRALRGEPVSVMRAREKKATWVPGGISRGAGLRVFVALPVLDSGPVLDGGRVLGVVLLSRTPADIGQAVWGKRWELGAVGAALLALGTVLALAASRLITRPLGVVTAQAAQVAAGETTAVMPLHRPGTREVAELSAALTLMAAKLEQRAGYIGSLATHIAHEFKTPLAAARGAAELLEDHGSAMSDHERAHFLGVVADSVARLDRLTGRLLELARADMMPASGAGPLPLQPMLARAAERFAPRGLQVAVAPSDARVSVAEDALEPMLDGLLANALAHAGPGQVDLSARAHAGRVLVRVADAGPGVSPANAARVFQPFFTTARAQGGTGLGLAIVAALAASAGGSVRLADSAQGAAFELDLPGA